MQLLSLLFSAAILLSWPVLQRRGFRHLRNGDKLLIVALALALFMLGINPDTFNRVLAFFSFTPGNSGRIIGLLVGAVFLLYFLFFRTRVQVSSLEHTIDRLVREIAKQRYRDEADTPKGAPICVVIPAYNEEDNIGVVLKRIPRQLAGLNVEAIVVVDGGTDDTEAVVRDNQAQVVAHVINRGGGAALHAGYDLALESGARVIVTLDADGQHLPEEMESLVLPILRGEAEMVNGSRVLGEYEQDQLIRAAGVVFFNRLVSLLTMQRITDCSNAFRAMSSEALAEVRPHLTQRQFHSTELLIEMIKRGRKVIEVPITIRRRLSGESKKGTTLRYATGFTFAIFSTWLR